jgi:MFS family permease
MLKVSYNNSPKQLTVDDRTQSRKNFILGILSIALTAVTSIQGAQITGAQKMAMHFHTTFTAIIQQTAGPRIIVACFGFLIAAAIAAVWGKRVMFVLTMFCLAGVTFTGYWENSIRYLTIVGAIQGFFAAPIELLLGPVIADMYFVHQRARKLAFIGVVVTIGGEVG